MFSYYTSANTYKIEVKMTQIFETITIETDERGVATLRLNRPEKHNALNYLMVRELRTATAQLAIDEMVRVVVLTGTGKSFCAGGDFVWFEKAMEASRTERVFESGELGRMLRDLDTIPKPLIGHINGHAYGGGVGMMSVCDVTIGSSLSRFGLTEVRIGLIPANISPYVIARIGVANSRATMLSGALFDGDQAGAIGLLNYVVKTDALESCVDAVVSDHLEAAPGAVAATKHLIRYVAAHTTEDNVIYTQNRLADAWENNESNIGITAFLNKKLPPWRSRS
jgi:methylglutaconyl-CoA hydratase